jgi:hypothetical protein
MQRTREVPCLLRDIMGDVVVTLEKGPNSSFGYTDWRCTDTNCTLMETHNPMRSDNDGPEVRLRSIRQRHGVTGCKGVGKMTEKGKMILKQD